MANISVIGAGAAGSAIISSLRNAEFNVTVGLRDPKKVPGAVSIDEAFKAGDVVFLAVPFDVGVNLAEQFKRELEGKVVVDMMNPLLSDLSGYQTFDGQSGAEYLQSKIPNSKVVKAFNHADAPVLGDPNNAVQFIIGADRDAVAQVADIARKIGFNAQEIVDLTKARQIEAFAFFWIYFSIIVKNNPALYLILHE